MLQSILACYFVPKLQLGNQSLTVYSVFSEINSFLSLRIVLLHRSSLWQVAASALGNFTELRITFVSKAAKLVFFTGHFRKTGVI
jgi:hypothetical protein